MSVLQPGRCRHCACGGDSCRLPDGEYCGWTDSSRLVCTAEPCQRAEAARLARAKAEAKQATRRPGSLYAQLAARGWGHGAIVQEIAKRLRKKGRAA